MRRNQQHGTAGRGVRPSNSLAETLEESEGRDGFKDGGPDRVEVDRTGHDRDDGFVGSQFRHGDLLKVKCLTGVFVA